MSNVINGNVPDTGLLKGSVSGLLARDGYSAYEIALKNGFEGTEEEWLLSLKGEKGERGSKGDRGEKGADGTVSFEDLTPEQVESLRGEDGVPGVYIGSGNMPDGYSVQIDPNGDSFSADDVYHTGNKPTAADVGAVPTVATYITAANNTDFNLDTGTDSLYIIESSLIPNCPISGQYVFVRQLFFKDVTATSSRTQIMYPYGYPNSVMPTNGLATRVYCNGMWSAWKNFATTDYALNKAGDTMSGELCISYGTFPRMAIVAGNCLTSVEGSYNKSSIQNYNAKDDSSNRRIINLYNSSGQADIAKALELVEYKNNATAYYNILHTGNKPSGSYTGNGSAEYRTIETGGIGNCCMVYGGTGHLAYLTPNGAFFHAEGVAKFTSDVSFSNGVIRLSNAYIINTANITYNYQVL